MKIIKVICYISVAIPVSNSLHTCYQSKSINQSITTIKAGSIKAGCTPGGPAGVRLPAVPADVHASVCIAVDATLMTSACGSCREGIRIGRRRSVLPRTHRHRRRRRPGSHRAATRQRGYRQPAAAPVKADEDSVEVGTWRCLRVDELAAPAARLVLAPTAGTLPRSRRPQRSQCRRTWPTWTRMERRRRLFIASATSPPSLAVLSTEATPSRYRQQWCSKYSGWSI